MYDEGLFHIGTLGFPTDELSKAMHEEIADYLDGSYDSHAVFVKDSDFDGHYSHYCKTILWPVLNYQIPDHPKSKAYADHSWQYYVKVNEAFADAIVRSYKHGDWIWVHDYHLMLVPALVRKQLPEARIAFFMHNAFPSSEIFRCLAMRRELLEGVLGSNAIMFQAEEYSYHFKQTCGRLLVVEATDAGVQFNGHLVNVSAIPIGIVRDELYRARSDPEVYEWTATLQGRYKDQKILASRDKLDNIRGVKQKLLAYELFLEQNPDWRDHVVLLQVITSTTGNDKDLAAAVSDIVTRINAKYSTLAHSPIVFLKQDIAFAQYLALLTVADVWMVTPLRDGMNLTCHDYIECQDGRNSCSKSHGCLILSEFTGSSELFKGQELAVNPWDFLQMSRSIKHALEMQTDEKERRYLALSDVVKRYDGIRWLAELKEQLGTAHEAHQLRDNHAVPRLPVNVLASRYQSSSRRLFLFDFEGTLDDWRFSHTSDSSTSTRMVDTLSCLIAASPNNTIYVASDRTMQDMENVFECIPDIGLIAENGCFVRPFANDDWQSLAGELSTQAAVWKQGITKQLEYYRERIVGSVIEERDCSIIFRYGQVESGEKVAAARQAGDLADHINEGCHIQRIKAVPLENAISIQPRDVDKVTACQFILDDFQSSKGNRKRSRTVASSTTEDYFTGSPPQEHAGGDHGLPSPISQSSELSESVIREGDVETPRALALSPAMEPSQQQQPIAEDSTSARALPDFLMVAGDDREDEPVYTWANQLRAQKDSADRQSAVDNVFTVCVGTRNTEASHTLTQGVTGEPVCLANTPLRIMLMLLQAFLQHFVV